MAAKNKELTFEEALSLLEHSAEALKSDDTTLEEAMNQYEQGMQYYNRCVALLSEAKKKIEIYDRSKEELKEFQTLIRS
jgi:exodeoxyribonuclease VII small subunit